MTILELPFESDCAARRALRRGAFRASAKVLRAEGYHAAAALLERRADALDTTADQSCTVGDDTTVVDLVPCF